ncbi:hypothetical protein SRDD_19510 [Serratia sp. DD3]|nr:hypothetical protein SRDD_19510 [Serratia sp. DD3]
MIAARVGIGGYHQGICPIFNQVELDQAKIEEQPVVCATGIRQAVIIDPLGDGQAVLGQVKSQRLIGHCRAIEVQCQVVDIGGIVGENQCLARVITDLIE